MKPTTPTKADAILQTVWCSLGILMGICQIGLWSIGRNPGWHTAFWALFTPYLAYLIARDWRRYLRASRLPTPS